MSMNKWAALFLLLSTSSVAAENEVNGDAVGDIYAACDTMKRVMDAGKGSYKDMFAGGVCQGFIVGSMAFIRRQPAAYCYPEDGVTYSNLVLIFVSFVSKNPVWRTRDVDDAIEAALADAFPCPSK